MRFIPDGYTEFTTIGDVLLHFRPMLRTERLEVVRAADKYPDIGAKASVYSAAIAQHILAWSRCGIPSEPALINLRFDNKPVWMQVLKAVLAVDREKEQQQDAERLHRSVLLRSLYPHLQEPGKCGYCKLHWYDPISNETARIEGGMRPDEAPPLCEVKGKGSCPLYHWTEPRGVTLRHQQAIEFDAECRSAGSWPDDPIVKRNARIIGEAERKIAQRKLRSR